MPIKAKPTKARFMTIDKVEAFARKFEIVSTGCWYWLGIVKRDGYTSYDKTSAHRFMWELVGNPVNPLHQLDHLCRNRACINPHHIEQVTPRTNTLRGKTITAASSQKTHCDYGHPFSGHNLYLRKRKRNGVDTIMRVCRKCNDMHRMTLFAKRASEAALESQTNNGDSDEASD